MRTLVAAYAAALALLLGLALAGGVVLYDSRGPADAIEAAAGGHEYSLSRWEVQNLPVKWLYKIGSFLTGRSSGDDDTIRRYFQLSDQIADLEPQADTPELKSLEDERAGLQNRVQDIIEGRMTGILEDQGLALRPPLFSDLGLIFPPVDFQLAAPPRVLAISPRDHIELSASRLLSPGLDIATVEDIERQAESAGDPAKYPHGVSALVINSGGLAAYPSIVSNLDSYESLIDTAFHEWTHQYLAFFPLGSRYYQSQDLRTLNESTANLSGHAMAAIYFQRYARLSSQSPATPQPTAAPEPSAGPGGSPAPAFGFTAEMRALRRQVDDLLTAGKTEEAEQLMDQKRDEFQTKGIYIRKLNQAYFAFHGSYADTPGSIDPIGPKLQALLDSTGSPGAFLRQAATLTSRADLDAVLGG
jgi:hypothetical protein